MKKVISFVLAVVLMLSCNISAFAIEDFTNYKTVSMEVEFSDNVGKSEYLTFMLKDNNVYVLATELALRLGYTILVQDECVVIYNDSSDVLPYGITVFLYNSTAVGHSIFSQMIDDYEAPFPSIKNGDDAWIPFEFSLMILGSSVSIIDNVLCIDIPEKSIVDVFYTVMKNRERYNFDWTDDFGYSDSDMGKIGSASHVINVFDGILKFDGDSWLQLFQAFANDTSAYESKYGEDIALLLCTESDKELVAETKKIKKLKDPLSSDGKIGKMLSQYSNLLDTDATAWANTCEAILNEVQDGNSAWAQYNKAYQALEKALDKQTWFSNTGGTILEVQKGAQSALPFLDAALTVLEVVGYGEEFQNQDDFSVSALNTGILNLEESSITSDAMQSSMLNYTEYLQTNAIAYSTKRYFDENIDSWAKKALGITELLGSQANIELLAWSLISSFIPRLSDSLNAADKFELALYSTAFSMDMFICYQGLRNEVFSDEKNITAENLYTVSQYCYIYLKACYVTREAALASLKGKSYSIQEQIQPLIDEQNVINEEIAELLVILKNANTTNDGLEYGFLPSDNKVYLSTYDSSVLVSVINEVSDHADNSTENSNSPDDATAIWEDFLIAGDYSTFTAGWSETSLEYTIADLNADAIPELLIQSSVDAPFYSTWLFVLDNTDIVLSSETYGYGSFRYSPSNNAVIGSPEWRPFSGTGYSPFYSLCGTQMEYIFQIGQDEGQSYYSDSTGVKSISDEERSAYYTDVINFEWKQIQSLNDYAQPAEFEGQLIGVLNKIVDSWTDGTTEYQIYADERFAHNIVSISNGEVRYRTNIENGTVEVTGDESAELAPDTQAGSLQTWQELKYDPTTDTIYIGNLTHPYYRMDDWISGNTPDVTYNEPDDGTSDSDASAEKTYGDNITWAISDGVLRATGVGKMNDYASTAYVPWYENRKDVTTVIMEGTITSVGDYAFDGFSNMTSITLPDTIRRIGEFAFWMCGDLSEIVIPDGCTVIENNAFNWCESLDSITLPATITEIQWNVFAKCENLSDIYYAGTAQQWNAITISSLGNEDLLTATVHYNSTGPDN
jgi:hypothetical protein